MLRHFSYLTYGDFRMKQTCTKLSTSGFSHHFIGRNVVERFVFEGDVISVPCL